MEWERREVSQRFGWFRSGRPLVLPHPGHSWSRFRECRSGQGVWFARTPSRRCFLTVKSCSIWPPQREPNLHGGRSWCLKDTSPPPVSPKIINVIEPLTNLFLREEYSLVQKWNYMNYPDEPDHMATKIATSGRWTGS